EFEAAPPENSWDQIRERLPQKRRRNPLILWWTGAAGIALMLSIPLWNDGSDNQSVVQTKETQIPEAPTHTITGVSESDDESKVANPLNEVETPNVNSATPASIIQTEPLRTKWASDRNPREKTSNRNRINTYQVN